MSNNFAENKYITSGNTGKEGVGTDQGMVTGLVLTDSPTGIATSILAKTLATWTEKFQAARNQREYAIGDFNKFESDENTVNYEEGDLGNDARLNNVPGENRFHIFVEPDQYSRGEIADLARVLNYAKKYAYIIFHSGAIEGYSLDGAYFKPYELGKLDISLDGQPTGEKTQHGVVRWKLKDVDLQLEKGVTIYPTDFDPNIDFYGLKNVNLTVTSTTPTTTTVEVDVTTHNSNTGVPSMAAADFVITADADGATVTPSGIAESTTVPGRYVLTFATQLAGGYTVALVESQNLTTKGIEQLNAAQSFTIP